MLPIGLIIVKTILHYDTHRRMVTIITLDKGFAQQKV